MKKYVKSFLFISVFIISLFFGKNVFANSCIVDSVSFSKPSGDDRYFSDNISIVTIKTSGCTERDFIKIKLKSKKEEGVVEQLIDDIPDLIRPNQDGVISFKVQIDEGVCYGGNEDEDQWGYDCVAYLEVYKKEEPENKLIWSKNIEKNYIKNSTKETLRSEGILVGNCNFYCSSGSTVRDDFDNWKYLTLNSGLQNCKIESVYVLQRNKNLHTYGGFLKVKDLIEANHWSLFIHGYVKDINGSCRNARNKVSIIGEGENQEYNNFDFQFPEFFNESNASTLKNPKKEKFTLSNFCKMDTDNVVKNCSINAIYNIDGDIKKSSDYYPNKHKWEELYKFKCTTDPNNINSNLSRCSEQITLNFTYSVNITNTGSISNENSCKIANPSTDITWVYNTKKEDNNLSYISGGIASLEIELENCKNKTLNFRIQKIKTTNGEVDNGTFINADNITIEAYGKLINRKEFTPPDNGIYRASFEVGENTCDYSSDFFDCPFGITIDNDKNDTNGVIFTSKTLKKNDITKNIGNFEIYQNKKAGIFYYECKNNKCDNDKKWRLIEENGKGDFSNPTPYGVYKPEYDKNSPCIIDKEDPSKGYIENCYEFLAPIQGIEKTPEGKADSNYITTEDGRIAIKDIRSYNLGDYINKIFQIAIGIIGVLAVIMIIVAGVQYMTEESITGKSDAKDRIIGAVSGLLLSLGIFIILNTINPELLKLNFGDKMKTISINLDNIKSFIDPKSTITLANINEVDYQTALRKKLSSKEEPYKSAYVTAKQIKIPDCIAKTIIERESNKDKKAIGHDENVTSTTTTSNIVYKLVTKKYSGAKKESGSFVKNDDVFDENKDNLGLDWRFGHGIGLSQVNFFPKKYSSIRNKEKYKIYKNWAISEEGFSSRKNTPTRKLYGKTYKPKDLLDEKTAYFLGFNIWKDFYNKCKTVKGAFAAYMTGDCNLDSKKQEAKKRTEIYNKCVNS